MDFSDFDDSPKESFKDTHYPLYPVNIGEKLHKKIGKMNGVSYYRIHGLPYSPDNKTLTDTKMEFEADQEAYRKELRELGYEFEGDDEEGF